MAPWNNWFHCTGRTYGTWLRGDPRGWRARHHREHVDGDYKNPPPRGKYDAVHALSKRLMKRERVILTPAQRKFACLVMGESLLYRQVDLLDLCVGAKHWHILARCLVPNDYLGARKYKDPHRDPRHLVGLAKKRSAREMSRIGLIAEGGVWAIRCSPLPIRDMDHLANVAKYILDHRKQGAEVCSLIAPRERPLCSRVNLFPKAQG
jgi:hypothetical protein